VNAKEAIEKVWQMRRTLAWGSHPSYVTKDCFELAARDLLELTSPNHGLAPGQLGIMIPDVKTKDEAQTLIYALLHTFLETAQKFPDADIGISQCREVRDALNRVDSPEAFYHSVSGGGFSLQYASVSKSDYWDGDALIPRMARLPPDQLRREVAPLYQGAWQPVPRTDPSLWPKDSDEG
jgi:hypothetical protein